MLFVVAAGGEITNVGIAFTVGSKSQTPQSGISYHVSRAVLERSEKVAIGQIEGVDRPVAKVSNQNVITKRTEAGYRLNDSPRSIQRSVRSKATDENTFLVENVHDPVSGAHDRIMFGCVLQSKSYEDLVADLLNVEWRVSTRQVGICKRSECCQPVEAYVVRNHETIVEISKRQIFPAAGRS